MRESELRFYNRWGYKWNQILDFIVAVHIDSFAACLKSSRAGVDSYKLGQKKAGFAVHLE